MRSLPPPSQGYAAQSSHLNAHEIGQRVSELVKVGLHLSSLFQPSFLREDLDTFPFAEQHDIFLKIGVFSEARGDEESSLLVEAAVNGAGVEEPIKGACFPSKKIQRPRLLFQVKPLFIGKEKEAAVEVGDDQAVVILLVQDLPEL